MNSKMKNKEKEFNLSEKILSYDRDFLKIKKEDVKEFIRRLKELLAKGKSKDPWGYWIINGDYEGLIKEIDKIVGKELI